MPANMSRTHESELQRRRVNEASGAGTAMTGVDNEADDEYASGAGIATDVCNDADEEYASSAGIAIDVCNDAEDGYASGAGTATDDVGNDDEFTRLIMLSQ